MNENIGNNNPEAFNSNKEQTQMWINEFDEIKGRQIEGLSPKVDNFSILEKEDYQLSSRNDDIVSDKRLEDFFLFINPSNGQEQRTIEAPHWRSISSNYIKAQYGQDYFYVANTKGCGFLKPTLKNINFRDFTTWTRTLDRGNSEQDYDNHILGILNRYDIGSERGYVLDRSKYLVENGLRTELFWGIAKLKKITLKSNNDTEFNNYNIVNNCYLVE
jgi:hypothetical protein